MRKDRVAAGGPERLPKGKGKWIWYPSIKQWNGWNPGPNQQQWSQWRPQPPGKGNLASTSLFQGPFQMSPFSSVQNQGPNVLQSLSGGPLQLSCVNPKRKSFESKITFEILQNQDDDEDDAEQPSPKLTVSLLDVLKRQTKHQVKNKKVRFLKPSHCACCSDTFEDFPKFQGKKSRGKRIIT